MGCALGLGMTFFKLEAGSGGTDTEPLEVVRHSTSFSAPSVPSAIMQAESLIYRTPDLYENCRAVVVTLDAGLVVWSRMLVGQRT
jgi:hypothetical protein